MWIWVARWRKKSDNQEQVKQEAEAVSKHWREVSLDIGMDPDKNVTVAEGDNEIRVGISEEVDMVFREEPGEWR